MDNQRKPFGNGSNEDAAAPASVEVLSPESSSDATAETRPSMTELERELAELLDEAPLLPEDDDEGSGVDFVPPPNLSSRPPPPQAAILPKPVVLTEPAPLPPPAILPKPIVLSEPAASSEPLARAVAATSAAPVTAAEPAPRFEAPPKTTAPEARGPRAPVPAASEPALGKGTRALVTTLAVAVVLVVGRLLTWPATPTDARRVQAGGASASWQHAPRSTGPTPERALAPRETEPTALRETEPTALRETEPTAPRETEPTALPEFSVVEMLTALAPAAIEAGRCRHTGDRKGRAYVRVDIAAGGDIEHVFAGHAYKDSETAACIDRKVRAAKLPPFSGKGGSVVLPVDLR